MNLTSKKAHLVLLAITALACSRMMFFFFNDPEGPNLLIVLVMAAVLFLVSLAVYSLKSFTKENIKLLLAMLVQVLLVLVLNVWLN